MKRIMWCDHCDTEADIIYVDDIYRRKSVDDVEVVGKIYECQNCGRDTKLYDPTYDEYIASDPRV